MNRNYQQNRPLNPTKPAEKGSCQICMDDNVSLINISTKCTHKPGYCLTCITNNLNNEVNTKGSYRFSCPKTGCDVDFETEEYYPLLNKKMSAIVDKILLNRVLENDQEFRWCKSSKGCGAGQLVSNYKDLLGYYICYACGQMLCYRHEIEWHAGFTCEEFEQEKAKNPDFASEATVLAFSKKCPNEKCGTPIMKLEGCDVMCCCRFGTHECAEAKGKCDHGGRNYCGQKFCWKCLGKIDVDEITKGFIRHCKPTCDYFQLN